MKHVTNLLLGMLILVFSGCGEQRGTVTAAVPDREPPDSVREATAVAASDKVVFTWVTPDTIDDTHTTIAEKNREFKGSLVLRGTTGRPLDLPLRETDYQVGDAIGASTVVYVGSDSGFTDADVTKGQTYSYAIMAYDGIPNYSDPAFVEATPGSEAKARFSHTATVLADGRLFVAGGVGYGNPERTGELFDPASDTFTPLGVLMLSRRFGHAATLLVDGRVLITGGYAEGFGASLRTATVFDPATDSFVAPGGDMTEVRAMHAQTLLPDGTVLVLGGSDGDVNLDTGETFDPATGTFEALDATMVRARSSFTATGFAVDGHFRVLIAGGYDGDAAIATAELFDFETRTFTDLAGNVGGETAMATSRLAHTATLLPGGAAERVLLCGGFSGNSVTGAQTASCEIFTAGGAFATGPAMTVARSGHDAVTLADGRVLLVGGIDADLNVLAAANLFDPATDALVAVGDLVRARTVPRASLLADGRVVVTGGNASGNVYDPQPISTAEAFAPSTLSFSTLIAP